MFFAHREAHLVCTLLGSCVAVCLWDPNMRVGGMNHYMLPLWNGRGLPTPKYGNIAIAKLISHLVTLGCRKGNLVAKVFGGASILDFNRQIYSIGERNIDIAKEVLDLAGIPILASEVGGTRAMKIEFHSGQGTVLLRKVANQGPAPLLLPDGRSLQ
jgi:chemotaxis protein CheD